MPARRRMLLNATLPKIFQRKVLRWLPPELGQYVLDAGRPFSLAGEIALVRTVSLQAPYACMCTYGLCYHDHQLLRHVVHAHSTTHSNIVREQDALSCRLDQLCRLWTRMCPTRQAPCSGQRTTRGQPSTARRHRRPAACSVSLLLVALTPAADQHETFGPVQTLLEAA